MENFTCRIEELIESAKEAIETLTKTISDQAKIIDVIETSSEAEYFADFVEGLKEATKNYVHQQEVLESRLEVLNRIVDKLETSEEAVTFLADLNEGLGLFPTKEE